MQLFILYENKSNDRGKQGKPMRINNLPPGKGEKKVRENN